MKYVSIRQNQSGAASLITVIFLAIILSVITTGLLRLSVQDARQATDDDLTNRAFYAAESGVNDALRFIEKHRANPATYDLNGNDCDPPPAELATINQLGFAALDTEYTCQLIDLTTEFVRNEVPADDVVQIPLTFVPAGPSPTGIIVRWHELGVQGDGDVDQAALDANSDALPPAVDWTTNGNLPAMLRVQLFSTPPGSFGRGAIENSVLFLNPRNAASAETITTLGNDDGEIINADCVTSDPGGARNGYSCEVVIPIADLGARDYELRATPIYDSAEVEISFNNSAEFEGVQAVIDVTGRAADVYRRVQASVNLSSNAEKRLLPSTAIRTIQDVCKIVTVDSGVNYDSCP